MGQVVQASQRAASRALVTGQGQEHASRIKRVLRRWKKVKRSEHDYRRERREPFELLCTALHGQQIRSSKFKIEF